MSSLIWAGTILAATSLVVFAGLRAWRGWLDLRRIEIRQSREEPEDVTDSVPGLRIEMADLKERLRKLEAIATGVDL